MWVMRADPPRAWPACEPSKLMAEADGASAVRVQLRNATCVCVRPFLPMCARSAARPSSRASGAHSCWASATSRSSPRSSSSSRRAAGGSRRRPSRRWKPTAKCAGTCQHPASSCSTPRWVLVRRRVVEACASSPEQRGCLALSTARAALPQAAAAWPCCTSSLPPTRVVEGRQGADGGLQCLHGRVRRPAARLARRPDDAGALQCLSARKCCC